MTTSIQCPPGTERVGMECIPLSGRPAGQGDIEYYRQYQQNLPQYQTRGQGTYTGMGTGAFHPNYGVPGKSQSASVLSTPLLKNYSEQSLTGIPKYAGGPFSSEIPGAAGGRSGYDSADVASSYRVRETPKRIDAPFSMGDPYSQGGSLWNVGRLMENRVDPYGGLTPEVAYDLRSRAAGEALPPGYTAGLGRTRPSEGYISIPDLLKAGGFSEGGGIPSTGIPAGAPTGGGGLFNLGGLFGGGAPAGAPTGGGGLFGGMGSGAPSRGGKGAGGAKKSGGTAKGSSSGLVGGIRKGAGTVP